MISCENKLNGYVNLKRTVGYQSTKIGKFVLHFGSTNPCRITRKVEQTKDVRMYT